MTSHPKKVTATEIGLPNCYRYSQDGWNIFHLEGSPYNIGKAYGYLITNELGEIKKMLIKTTPIFYGHSWNYFVGKTKEIYGDTIPKEYQEELHGIADGVKLMGGNWDYWDLLTWNCQLSIMDYWWKICQKKTPCQVERCSCLLATGDATMDGGIILAHNTWDVFYHARWCNCIVDLKPEKGHRMLMQTFYGYLTSLTDFFVTDAGIIGSDTTIRSYNLWKLGVPCFVRLRQALQYADDLTSFTKYLIKDNGGDYANTWFLGDIKTNLIMKFDLGVNHHSIKTKTNGYFVGFNETESNKIRNLECDHNSRYNIFNIRTGGGARRVRLKQLMEQHYGEITVEVAKTIIGDNYDVYTGQYGHSHRTIEGRYDLDSEGNSTTGPHFPSGAVDAKIITTELAKDFSFLARWGSSSGIPFKVGKFCQEHPQWGFLEPYLKDLPVKPWTTITG